MAGEVVSGVDSITVSAEPLCVTWTLEELCPACSAGQPLAAIATERQQTWRLPPEVVSVRISGGTVLLSLDHDLDFAPVRAGELELSAVSIGAGAAPERELLSWKLDRDLDPGTPVTLALDFSRNPVTVSGGLRLRFAIATDPDPAAPPVPDLTRVIRARAHVQSVTIDSAVVRLDEQEVAGEEEFDLGDQSDVDELVGRISSRVPLPSPSSTTSRCGCRVPSCSGTPRSRSRWCRGAPPRWRSPTPARSCSSC